jgi:hypothetical protein
MLTFIALSYAIKTAEIFLLVIIAKKIGAI